VPRRLAVAAVVKDGARTAARLFRGIAGLGRNFDAISFAIYENNSSDDTKAVLDRLSAEISDMRVVCEDLSRERQEEIASVRHKDGRPCRIEILAYARERARSLLLDAYGGYEYALVVDADAFLFSRAGIIRAARAVDDGIADCVCANGLMKRLQYRDAFAFRSVDHPFGPEFLGDYWRDVVRKRIQRRHGGARLIPVFSAFGGAALFRMEAFKAGRYSAIPDEGFLAAHRSLDLRGANADESRRASRDPVPSMNYLSPIVCEHVPFCYSMRTKGFDRIFVDPRWRILFLD
jgi:hypothetical protein